MARSRKKSNNKFALLARDLALEQEKVKILEQELEHERSSGTKKQYRQYTHKFFRLKKEIEKMALIFIRDDKIVPETFDEDSGDGKDLPLSREILISFIENYDLKK